MRHEIDILIPSYKGERYLPLCLLALVQSNYKKYKIYISIDGTIDNFDYIQSLIKSFKIPAVLYTNENRLGLAENRKLLLKVAKSDYILWLDDDVLVAEDTLEKIVTPIEKIGNECSIITGVGSNILGLPKVACGLGLTLFDRRTLVNDKVLFHDFGYNTGEDWLWTARVVYKSGLPIKFVPTAMHHIGENRRKKRYSRKWDSTMFNAFTDNEFYDENKEELELSYPVYNYIDY